MDRGKKTTKNPNKKHNPNPNRGQRNPNRTGTSSSQPNPNFVPPNQPFFDFTQSGNQLDFSQFLNQFQGGFSQFTNEAGGSMPVQTGYNEFRVNSSPQFEREVSSEDEEQVPETQEQEEEDEDEVEEVPAPTAKGKKVNKFWNQKEEEALAKAFIGVSEDPVRGNHQKTKSFWKKVLFAFNEHLGEDSGRNHDQVRSKWKDLNNKVTSFAGIYHKRKSNMSSGMNDEDVYKASQKEYASKYNIKGSFPHLLAWEVMRQHPKWSGVMTFEEMEETSSKRAKTSSSNMRSFGDEFAPLDLNDELDVQDAPEPPVRPTEAPRRNRKKPQVSTSTDREELTKWVAEFNSYNKEEVEDKKRARAEKLRMKEKEMEARIARDEQVARFVEQQQRHMMEQQKQRDLEFILTDHSNLTGSMLEIVMARKREIAAQWGWEF